MAKTCQHNHNLVCDDKTAIMALSFTAHSASVLIRIVLVFALTAILLKQVRKPSRWIGRPFLWLMNMSHSGLTDWGLSHVQISKDFVILDVGCGGGKTMQKLARLAENGKVYGVDYAEGSVAESRAKNQKLIQDGRMEVLHASVSSLPFTEDKFDLVTAIETQYYWPDLVHDMSEVGRVLKPGGKLMILAEAYKREGDFFAQRWLMNALGSGYLSISEQQQLFAKAGFTDIQVAEGNDKQWICVVGTKPLA